jgi:hypothetical protein
MTGPIIKRHVEYYDVSGPSARELLVAIKGLGPEDRGAYPGTRRELRARYRLEWEGWDRVCRSP